MKTTSKLLRGIAAIVMSSLVVTMMCGCSISGKRKLIEYAENRYGECEFLREKHGGSGDDEYRTVYLRDKDTGIEYSVTSDMRELIIDASSLGKVPSTSSDFEELYYDWLLEEAEDDLDPLADKNGFEYRMYTDTFVLTFSDRIDSDDAFGLAKDCDKILKEYDVKDMRPFEFVIYAEETVFVGSYNTNTKNEYVTDDYLVIDYVRENYDPDAVFLDSLGAYLSEFLSYEEIDELFPDGKGMTSGTAYYFRDSDGDTFIAIYMEAFGAKGGVRLFRETTKGMEEIYI